MEFLEQMDSFYIKMGIIIVFAIGYFFVARKDNLKLTLQYLLYSYGIMMLLLSITIPHVFPGYPDDMLALENKKRLLYHLQKSNEALAETTQVIREMALLTFAILVSVVSKMIKHFKLEKSAA
jgi:UDP-N-acetylmuramyl pentapeptide phosphotransferase/UDP-N-acetylglucosamine-1-phosphate transferase